MSDFRRCDACPVKDLQSCPAERHARYCALAAKGGVWPDKIRAKAEAESGPAAAVALAEPLDPWAFVTETQLLEDSLRLLAALPPDVDAVVGVFRSAMMAATPIATRLHLPLWTITRGEGLTWPGFGWRMEGADRPAPRHVALIDDTIATGREMSHLTPLVKAAFPGAKVTRAVVYASPASVGLVDLYVRLYPGAHYLAWNWQNAGHGERCGYDFDGILCEDWPFSRPGPEPPPLYLPRRLPIPLIITGRGESARGVSEAWLARHGVRCERMIMRPESVGLDAPSIGAYKAEHYAASDLPLFAESDPVQAAIIAERSGKPVLCPAARRVFPGQIKPAEPALPSFGRMALNYARAQARHTLDRRRKLDDADTSARVTICENCPSGKFRAGDRRCAARQCGCPVESKARWASETCPAGHWPAPVPATA